MRRSPPYATTVSDKSKGCVTIGACSVANDDGNPRLRRSRLPFTGRPPLSGMPRSGGQNDLRASVGEKLGRRRQVRVCADQRSEEHTSELQSRLHLVCRLLLEKKKKKERTIS